MITAFYLLLVASVVFYLAAFSYETVTSFSRLRKRRDSGYAHATWEITHTILVLAIVAFFITHSSILPEIAKATFVAFFVVIFGFIVRGVTYLILFFDRDEKRHRIGILDYVFAGSHIVILGGLLAVVVGVVPVLLSHSVNIETSTVGWYVWGFIALIVLCALPLFQLYRRSK